MKERKSRGSLVKRKRGYFKAAIYSRIFKNRGIQFFFNWLLGIGEILVSLLESFYYFAQGARTLFKA